MTAQTITTGKYVELTYIVIDQKSNAVLTRVEHPLGYVHGTLEILAPAVMAELVGKAEGERVEVPIDCNELYGPRDESLLITARIEDVPEEYREVGTSILMENEQGQTKSFLVTDIDARSITIDGNNPLAGREVIFEVTIQLVRDATEQEIEYGGKIPEGADQVPGPDTIQ
jgi:FKBP-type peptidyl-prolyl cis-trans isomerase SlyD